VLPRRAKLHVACRMPAILGIYFLTCLWLFVSLPVTAETAHPHPETSKSIFVSGNTSEDAKSDSVDHTLKPDEVIQRRISGGESHFYSILLPINQYLRVSVDQRDIDLIVVLFGPEGKEIASADSPNSRQGPEELSAITETEGTYRLELRSVENDAPQGIYKLQVDELRAPTAQDLYQGAAARAYNEGTLLFAARAEESTRKSIEKFSIALSIWREVGDKQREINALYARGRAYAKLANYRHALADYSQSYALTKATGDLRSKANTLTEIGRVYRYLGENRKSLDVLSQALPLMREAGNRQGEAATLSNIGEILFNLGENQKALEYLNQTLAISREIADRQTEAYALSSIGAVYSLMGENEKAIDSFKQALALNRATGNRRGEAFTLNNMGEIYFDLGNPQKALDYYRQSLPLSKAVGDRHMEAYSLSNIGMVYSSRGEFKTAIDAYHQALVISKTIENRRGEARALYGLGVAHSLEGDNEKARTIFERALTFSREVDDRVNEAQILFNLGAVQSLSGDDPDALALLSQALVLSRAINDLRAEASTLYWIARVERNRGCLNESRQHIEKALELIDSQQIKFSGQDVRTSYFASVQKYYEFYVDLLMQLHAQNPSEGLDAIAWQISERARARSFLGLLPEIGVAIRQGVPSSLIDREKTLQQLLNSKAERRVRLLGGKHSQEEAAAISKEIEELLTEYDDVQAQIRRQSPRYAALTQPRPLSLKEIQAQVVDRDTLLLEYALGDDRSFLWLITPTSVTSYVLPKRAEIETAARSFQETLSKPGLPLDAAYQLSNMLLGPAVEHLGTKRLLIVAQGPLLSLPFGALPLPSTAPHDGVMSYTPIITRHEITYSPSASVLAVLRREMIGRKLAPKAVAVFADPVFSKNDARVPTQSSNVRKATVRQPESLTGTYPTPTLKNASTIGQAAGGRLLPRLPASPVEAQQILSFPRLPTSRWEARQILSLVPEDQGKLALDFDANRATATNPELSQYRIIHFATHGILDETHPELSGIVLSSVDQQGRPQDGTLRANEIFNLNLSAELVVLSGCRTGLGKEVEGEGKIGLARAFMYAGAARVIESLWNVDDRATAELMARFYKAMLKDRLTPAAALRRAQLEILRDAKWRHPYYWASFVLQGEWK
jgi:CHAT domain-containing protein/tetratricopeptide (TPR) repeat protein